jgi:hypothetical protein
MVFLSVLHLNLGQRVPRFRVIVALACKGSQFPSINSNVARYFKFCLTFTPFSRRSCFFMKNPG